MIRTSKEIYGRSASLRGLGVLDGRSAIREFEASVALNDNGVSLWRDPRGGPVPAYVDKSRWVFTCPACGSGAACSPDISEGACLECGRIHGLKFPTRHVRLAAEAELLKRPKEANRNWFPFDVLIGGRIHTAETVETLRLENVLIEREDLLTLGLDLDPEIGGAL